MIIVSNGIDSFQVTWPQGSLSEPDGTNTLAMAVMWVEQMLLGPLTTAIAIIAVAFIGFAMLTGRTNWRHAVTVILGCFILFGARDIATALHGLVSSLVPASPLIQVSAPPPAQVALPAPRVRPTPPAQNPDPYAGASVPVR